MSQRLNVKSLKYSGKANYAFIDSQNLNLGVKSQGWELDFGKFRIYLKNKYNVEIAYLFIGQLAGNESLYDSLQAMGYRLIFKPTTQYKVKGKITVKGNVDAELVLYAAAKVYDNYNKAIIVSGDGDFYCLAEYLAERDKLYKILVPNTKFSHLLSRFDSYIKRIDHSRDSLERKTNKKTGTSGRYETLGIPGHGDSKIIAQNNKKDQHRRSVETLGLSGHGDPPKSIAQHHVKNKPQPRGKNK